MGWLILCNLELIWTSNPVSAATSLDVSPAPLPAWALTALKGKIGQWMIVIQLLFSVGTVQWSCTCARIEFCDQVWDMFCHSPEKDGTNVNNISALTVLKIRIEVINFRWLITVLLTHFSIQPQAIKNLDKKLNLLKCQITVFILVLPRIISR